MPQRARALSGAAGSTPLQLAQRPTTPANDCIFGLLRNAMSVNPAERPTALELCALLRQAQADLGFAVTSPSLVPGLDLAPVEVEDPMSIWLRRFTVRALVIATLFLMLAIGLQLVMLR